MNEAKALTRRSLLAVGGAVGIGFLAACAPGQPAAVSVPPQTLRPSAAPTRTPTATPTPTPSPTPTVDLAAVVERHAKTVPQQWGMEVTGVRSSLHAPTSPEGKPRVALTFDACGGQYGSEYDVDLIDGLRSLDIPVTLFLNARWISAHPRIAEAFAADPLVLLANHGTAHVPLSVTGRDAYGIHGTASAQAAADEVWGNHEVLTALVSKPPQFFRSGTAHYDEVGAQIAIELGEIPIGFTINCDGGATYEPGTVRREFGRATAGDIVIAHMNQPRGGTREGALKAAHDLLAQGVEFVHVDG